MKTKRTIGNRNTFLSKTTIEMVCAVIAKMVRDTILDEVQEAGGKYGILLDSMQDISVIDQVCIGIRYVFSEPKEHLLCITPSLCGTGEGLFQLLKSTLENSKIALADCIIIALNLVICDSCTSISALNLFGLVQKLAGFFSRLIQENGRLARHDHQMPSRSSKSKTFANDKQHQMVKQRVHFGAYFWWLARPKRICLSNCYSLLDLLAKL